MKRYVNSLFKIKRSKIDKICRTKIKKKLVIISPTDVTLEALESVGHLSRQIGLIKEYAKFFDVEYYTADIKDYSVELNAKHRYLPLAIRTWGLRHIFFYLFLLLSAIRMKGPIRILAVGLPITPLIKKISRQPIIINFDYDWASKTKRDFGGFKGLVAGPVQKVALRSSDFVACTTKSLEKTANRMSGGKIIYLPNFVDTDLFKPSQNKKNFILFASRLHWAKGPQILLRAFKKLQDVYKKDLKLVICGSGDYRTSLEGIIEEENINNVVLKGAVEHKSLSKLMSEALMFVLPTITEEGHPRALIEAMSCGAPCIATNVPGITDVITDKVNGLIVEPEDVHGLYCKMKLIIDNEDLRKNLSQNARIHVEQNYSLNLTLKMEINLLMSIDT